MPKEPPKPIFPIKHDFYASMDNFIHLSGMLADAVAQALDLKAVSGPAAQILQERLDAFNQARGG